MSRTKGFWGEGLAAQYLERCGFQVLQRNFYSSYGEIDLILKDNDYFVFVEVKTWDFASDDNLEASINNQKRQRIIKTSQVFLSSLQIGFEVGIRYDIILISLCGKQIRHYPGAFTEAGFT